MHDIFLAGPVTPVDAIVDKLGAGVGASQMLKSYFVDVDGDDFFPVIPVYGKAEVGHIAEVGGAVDVVHLHSPQFAVSGVAVHLARMRHEDNEALVLQGEAAQLVQQRGDVLQFRLSRFQLLVDAVQRVDDKDAHSAAAYQLAGLFKNAVHGIASRVR